MRTMRNAFPFAHAEALLRYFRPDYDNLGCQEKAALILGLCARIDEFQVVLERLVEFAEYATYLPDRGKVKKLKSATKYVDRDIRAALLREVEGLSNKEIQARINKELSIKEMEEGLWIPNPKPEQWQKKRDASTARSAAGRGHKLLTLAFSARGWAERVQAKKAQRDRWRTLSEEERKRERATEVFADAAGLSVDEFMRVVQHGDPDESRDGAFYLLKAYRRGVEKLQR